MMEHTPVAGVIVVGVVAIVFFGFCSLVLAVILDCAAEARAEDAWYKLWLQSLELDNAKLNFTKVCAKMDVDKHGVPLLAESWMRSDPWALARKN